MNDAKMTLDKMAVLAYLYLKHGPKLNILPRMIIHNLLTDFLA